MFGKELALMVLRTRNHRASMATESRAGSSKRVAVNYWNYGTFIQLAAGTGVLYRRGMGVSDNNRKAKYYRLT
jgi:hypothetical protein